MNYYIKKKSTLDGKDIDEIFISNEQTEISFLNHGARINRWIVNGDENIVLGSDNVEDFFTEDLKYFGATIGRTAGRTKNSEFQLNGQHYPLDNNEGANHLHGGLLGYNDVIWNYEVEATAEEVKLSFFYTDVDGANGYPGNLKVQVDYIYDNDNKLTLEYYATSDQDTVFAPTNHVYFNLSGNNSDTILDHELMINSDQYVPLEEDSLPTGGFADVSGTPFDFKTKRTIRTSVNADHPQIIDKNGIDHPFILNHDGTNSAELSFNNHKIVMNTDQKTVVVYTVNEISDDLTIWDNPLKTYHGVTLETQDVPNSINQDPNSGSILPKDVTYRQTTSYQYLNKGNLA